jgi:hypothetical protein
MSNPKEEEADPDLEKVLEALQNLIKKPNH